MVLLIGNGYMGKEYIKSLLKLNIKFKVIGNSKKSCEITKKLFPEITIFSGGITKYIKENKISSTKCIIATPIYILENILEEILKTNITDILIEKPGGLNLDNMKRLCTQYLNKNIVLAYNRRFYESVKKAKQIIKDDGGVQSFSMKITELIHKINPKLYNKDILDKWFLSMTTHLIDLSFYLCGEPKKIISMTKKGYDWYEKSGIFCGCGETEKGALFSYHGDWTSAGRWGLEICTLNHLIIFSPLEKIKIQKKGEMNIAELNINEDSYIKPGIFKQTKLYIENSRNSNFITYKQHCKRIEDIYNIMGNL